MSLVTEANELLSDLRVVCILAVQLINELFCTE